MFMKHVNLINIVFLVTDKLFIVLNIFLQVCYSGLPTALSNYFDCLLKKFSYYMPLCHPLKKFAAGSATLILLCSHGRVH